jgi:hypothetical protein
MPSYYVEWVVGDEDDGYVIESDSMEDAEVDALGIVPQGAIITGISQVGDCCG